MRYLFVFLFVFSLAACGDSDKGGTSSAKQPARLGHVGQWFVDDKGRVVVLYGINMVRKRETYAPSDWGFDEDDIEYIAAQGFNTLRLGFTWKGLEPNPSEYDREYLRKIMDTARLAGEAGLWVLLDFHQDMYNEKYQGLARLRKPVEQRVRSRRPRARRRSSQRLGRNRKRGQGPARSAWL